MRSDLDARIGDVFRRLSLWRVGLGEDSLSTAVDEVLRTLGAAALREAEYRAGILAARKGARPGSVRVDPWGERRTCEDWPD